MLRKREKGVVGPWEVLVVALVLAFVGFVVWRVTTADNTEQIQTNAERDLDLPTISYENLQSLSEFDRGCSQEQIELFDESELSTIYVDEEAGFSFVLPEKWVDSATRADEGSELLCVGPFVIAVWDTESSLNYQGDDPLATASYGYYVEDGVYYYDDPDSPYNAGAELTETLTLSGKALLLTSDCAGIDWCSNIAVVNLLEDDYTTVTIRSDRPMNEDAKQPNQKVYTFSQVENELKQFLSHLEVK